MKGVGTMKDKIHTINTFRSDDIERLKKAVTEKIEKLLNTCMKKAG